MEYLHFSSDDWYAFFLFSVYLLRLFLSPHAHPSGNIIAFNFLFRLQRIKYVPFFGKGDDILTIFSQRVCLCVIFLSHPYISTYFLRIIFSYCALNTILFKVVAKI